MRSARTKSFKVFFILHHLTFEEFNEKKYFYDIPEFLANFFLKYIPPRVFKLIYSLMPAHFILRFQNFRVPAGNSIDIFGVMCPLWPEEVVLKPEFALQKVIGGVNLAIRNSADVIVLTGFTSIVGNQGKLVRKHFENSSAVITTGNALTAAICVEQIIDASRLFDIDLRQSVLAVIGSTGDIGSICAKIFSQKVKKLILCSRKIDQDDSLYQELVATGCSAEVVVDKFAHNAAKQADVVLIATSSFLPIIEVIDLKPFSIVCDVSLPYSFSNEVSAREDVFVFDGGKAELPPLPYPHEGKWAKFTRGGIVYGCIAEGMVLGLEGRLEDFSLGRGNLTEQKITEIFRLAKINDVKAGPFAFHGKRYEESIVKKKIGHFLSRKS